MYQPLGTRLCEFGTHTAKVSNTYSVLICLMLAKFNISFRFRPFSICEEGLRFFLKDFVYVSNSVIFDVHVMYFYSTKKKAEIKRWCMNFIDFNCMYIFAKRAYFMLMVNHHYWPSFFANFFVTRWWLLSWLSFSPTLLVEYSVKTILDSDRRQNCSVYNCIFTIARQTPASSSFQF